MVPFPSVAPQKSDICRAVQGEATGAGLFDWKTDRAVLEGAAPFEFRVVSTPQHPKQQMLPWSALLEAAHELNRMAPHDAPDQSACRVS